MTVYYRYRNTRANYRIIEDSFEAMYCFYGIEHKIKRDRDLLNNGALLIRYDEEGNKLSISKNRKDLEN